MYNIRYSLLNYSIYFNILPEETWISTRELVGVDSDDEDTSDEEGPVVPIIGNTEVTTTYSTATKNISTMDFESKPVLNERDNFESMNIDSNSDTEITEMDFITYAIQDVENIDNVNFDDEENSALEDDISLEDLYC